MFECANTLTYVFGIALLHVWDWFLYHQSRSIQVLLYGRDSSFPFSDLSVGGGGGAVAAAESTVLMHLGWFSWPCC